MPDTEQTNRFRADIARLIGTGPDGPLGLAVSGGVDSLGLLLLAATAFPGRVRVATVDHALRAESSGEARFVETVCASLGVPCAILRATWAQKPTGNVQAAARAQRYDLMGGWARDHGSAAVATAHHADDQAETLLMRLARGAGLSGLSAIRPTQRIGDLMIIRPLLGWRRAELAAIVEAENLTPIVDPSNADPRYDRTHARALLAQTPWLDADRLAAAAAHLAAADSALDWAAVRAWSERAVVEDGRARIDAVDLPDDIQRRLVARVFAALAQDNPTGPDLQRLLQTLRGGGVATLGGLKAFVERSDGGAMWRFEPTPPRRRS